MASLTIVQPNHSMKRDAQAASHVDPYPFLAGAYQLKDKTGYSVDNDLKAYEGNHVSYVFGLESWGDGGWRTSVCNLGFAGST